MAFTLWNTKAIVKKMLVQAKKKEKKKKMNKA
jgi:hypothetical protein